MTIDYALLFSMTLKMIVQKKNTPLTKRTRNEGLTKAILITEAGIQSFPVSKEKKIREKGDDGPLNLKAHSKL